LPLSTDQNKQNFCQKLHCHGGQLQRASQQYKIPLEQWLDLSTGINPNSYPLPDVPHKVWQRLPEINDGLEHAASQYYGSEYLLPVAGSQEAIQRLPAILSKQKKLKVGIIKPAYHSHQQAWEKLGHEVISLATKQITTTSPSKTPAGRISNTTFRRMRTATPTSSSETGQPSRTWASHA